MNIDTLKLYLQYRSDGSLIWIKKPAPRYHINSIAGHIDLNGYIVVGFKGKIYKAHRLVWFLHKGSWPIGVIDHIDGIKTNNSISNLREVTTQVNSQNRYKSKSDNSTGLLGVSSSKGKFMSRIQKNKKTHYLGTYDTAEEAYTAYVKAKRNLHEGNNL